LILLMILTRLFVAAATLFLTVGCSDNPTEPEEQEVATHTVDASGDWSYVALGNTVTPVTVADPASSAAWDLGFKATGVRVNGSAFGSAGVEVYCICQNPIATMSAEQILAMTPESELADFNAVTSADIPANATAWDVGAAAEAGAFSANPWHKYNLDGNHTISPTFNVYLVKRGTAVYKLQVINYYIPSATGVSPRHVAFRYAKLQG
jgi:hypothetical protein